MEWRFPRNTRAPKTSRKALSLKADVAAARRPSRMAFAYTIYLEPKQACEQVLSTSTGQPADGGVSSLGGAGEVGEMEATGWVVRG